MKLSWARVHAWLAIVLVSLLVIWSITGLLFHLKPGWGRAYDMLSIERGGTREELDTAIGPLVRVDGVLEQGPLTEAQARALVEDAVSRSRFAYGSITSVDVTETAIRFHYPDDIVVTIDRGAGWISQRGADTDRIDWYYRIHYLQFTGNKGVDRAIAVVGLGLIWAVMIPGVVLFVRRLRRRQGS